MTDIPRDSIYETDRAAGARPHLAPAPPSLRAAVREARIEQAERSTVVAELRGAERARLDMLLEALRPVLDQTPEDVDLFDAGIAPGDRPRLFIDMIAYVEMGHDRRQYRFFQETRHGRILIAESERIDPMLEALTSYIARRLVEREQALAADFGPMRAPAVTAEHAAFEPEAAPVHTAPVPSAPPRRRWRARCASAFLVLIEILGALTLFALLAAGVFVAARYGEGWWLANMTPR